MLGVFYTLSTPAVFADGDNYTTLDSGLKYLDLVEGTGSVPKPGDTVRVHYTGWLDEFNGEKKFDSSYDRRSPLVFKVVSLTAYVVYMFIN